jgi:hypothetical protein
MPGAGNARGFTRKSWNWWNCASVREPEMPRASQALHGAKTAPGHEPAQFLGLTNGANTMRNDWTREVEEDRRHA